MSFSTVIRFSLAVLLTAGIAAAQTEQTVTRMAKGKVGVSPDEQVSFKSDVPFSQAIQALGELSKKFDGKILIDRSPSSTQTKAIGVNIEAMYWKDALELILRTNQLWYNDYPEYRDLVPMSQVGQTLPGIGVSPGVAGQIGQPAGGGAVVAPVDSGEIFSKLPEVVISSVFFEIDQTKLSQLGLSYNIFRGRDLNLAIDFQGANQLKELFSVTVNPTDPRLAVDIKAGMRMMESHQLGDVIARPQVTVRSGSPARIQIGADISIKEKDFSGNTVDKFYATGTILQVKPRVYKVGDLTFIDLNYYVERSTPTITTTTTTIDKTNAQGVLSLLNGEESYVGGMYSNVTTKVREGIPVLMDLPWWFFGLRYIFGYETETTSRKELLVLIKAELVPLPEDRAAKPLPKDVLQKHLQESREDLERRLPKK